MRDDESFRFDRKSPPKRMRGRPREFDEDDILLRLMNLFWSKGYERTSLSDIVEATGLKKGSLYALFGGKRDMYLKSLAHYDAKYVQAACISLTDQSAGSPRERLDQFISSPIDALIKQNDQRGCFLCNATAEIAKDDENIRGSIAASYDEMQQALESVLREALPSKASEDIIKRAHSLLVTYTGLRILARTSPDVALLQGAKKAALEF